MGKMTVKSIMGICAFWLLMLLSSCSFEGKETEGNEYKLTPKEINEVLSLVTQTSNSDFNFHVLYSEYFNDSTFVIDIWQHQHSVDTNKLVTEVFHYNENKVYIYNNIPSGMREQNKENTDLSLFFVVDANHWAVLVKRRKSQNQYFKIEIFSSYSNDLEIEDNLEIF